MVEEDFMCEDKGLLMLRSVTAFQNSNPQLNPANQQCSVVRLKNAA